MEKAVTLLDRVLASAGSHSLANVAEEYGGLKFQMKAAGTAAVKLEALPSRRLCDVWNKMSDAAVLKAENPCGRLFSNCTVHLMRY